DSKRLSVVPASRPGDAPYQLTVPAASLKDFGGYLTKLNSLDPRVPYNAVITKASFDSEASYPKLLFTAVRYLTGPEYETVEARYDDDDVKLTAGIAKARPEPASEAPVTEAEFEEVAEE